MNVKDVERKKYSATTSVTVTTTDLPLLYYKCSPFSICKIIVVIVYYKL